MAPKNAPKSKATSKDAVDDVVQEKNEEGAKMVDKKVDKKPKKKLDKVTKPKKHSTNNPTVAEMVKIALSALKSRQGCTLSAIRNYITKNYEGEMTKQRQYFIKKFLLEEFQDGRLKMTNDDKPYIDFSKRFNIVNRKMEE